MHLQILRPSGKNAQLWWNLNQLFFWGAFCQINCFEFFSRALNLTVLSFWAQHVNSLFLFFAEIFKLTVMEFTVHLIRDAGGYSWVCAHFGVLYVHVCVVSEHVTHTTRLKTLLRVLCIYRNNFRNEHATASLNFLYTLTWRRCILQPTKYKSSHSKRSRPKQASVESTMLLCWRTLKLMMFGLSRVTIASNFTERAKRAKT